MTESRTASAPVLDDSATRLLAALDSMPVRMNDRDRLMRALDVLCSTEWIRVIVRLTADEMASLRRPALQFTPHELTHVVEVARTLAGSYSYGSTSAAHVAVALALTARPVNVQRADLVAVIAEAFGLGTLDEPHKVLDQHLTRVSQPPSDDAGGAPSPSNYRTDRGDRLHQAAIRTHVAARGAAAVVLLVAAAIGDSGWAWPVAFLPLVTARDPYEPTYVLGEQVSPGQLPTRWPLPGAWAILAAALGLSVASVVFVILAVVLAVVTAGGEALTAREHRFAGAQPGALEPAIARLASLSESFETTRRGVRVALTLAMATPVAVLAAATTTVWPLYFLAALLIPRRSPLWATVALTVAALLDGFGWMVPLTVLAGIAAQVAIGHLMRPPELAVPVPGDTRRDRKARRMLRTGRPVAAVRLLQSGNSPLLAWALLTAGYPGDAKAAARKLPAQARHLRGLVTCLAELELANPPAAAEALEALEPLGDAPRNRALREQLLIADARVRVRLGQETGLDELIASRIPTTPRRRTLLAAAEQVRLVAEARIRADPALSWFLASIAFHLIRFARAHRPMRYSFTHLHKERNLDLETVRAVALMERAELRAGWSENPGIDFEGSGNAASFLLRMDRPMEAAAHLDEVADHQVTPLHRLDALNNRIEALAALHWARHHLRNLEERRLWWRTVSASFEKAMTQAVAGQDWATLAELIESARLQLNPLDDELSGDRTAPYVRVRGVSRLEEAAWYRPAERPYTYTIENMAQFTLGPGTWWWSTWSVTHRIFWALVPPDGPVTGGLLACGPGSTLATTLADLRDALPIRYPGEQDDDFRSRVFGGALCGLRQVEADLAHRLGDLIPVDLRDAIIDQPETSIAVSPAHALANVPWPVIAVARSGRSVRLVDRCRLVVAPPAALLGAIALRDWASDDAPLKLAVLDPGGDSAPPHAQLRAARDLGDMLPDVHTVGRSDMVDLDGIGAILRELPAASSAVFACHTHPGDGRPLSQGLVVRPGTRADPRPVVLSAADLTDPARRYPVPRQALLLACDSADLRQAADGEWLVLGPAMLWAGADRVIVTTFDTPDLNVVDRQLVQHLLDGHDMVESLRAVQADPLRGLPDPDERLARPLFWAGYVAMGAFGDPAVMTRVRSSRTRYVSNFAVSLVEDAAERAALVGRCTVLPRDLILALALFGYEEDLSAVRRVAIRAVAYPWTLFRHARNRVRRPAPTPGVTVGPEVTALLNAAADLADVARHRVVDTEHVLAAVLAASGPASSAARLVSGLDARQSEVVKELIADTQDGFHDLNRPTIRALTSSAVAGVYDTFGARPAEGDGWGQVLLCDLG